jgi:predicted nucleotidyltransferase
MRAISDPADAAKFAAEAIRRHVPDPVYRVFLFGSRAAGSATERSDIDIGIEGPAPVPRSALAAIQEELEEAPTLYTIDVVDFRRVPENFRRLVQHRLRL